MTEATPASGAQPTAEELRNATFPPALKGYDREAVHALLDRVADTLELGAAGYEPGEPDLKRELERVGERTAGILTAAEEAAATIRSEAREYAAATHEAADEEARQVVAKAKEEAEGLVGRAEADAKRTIDEATERRDRLEAEVSTLLERRRKLAGEARRLGSELVSAAEALASETGGDEAALPGPAEPAPRLRRFQPPGEAERDERREAPVPGFPGA